MSAVIWPLQRAILLRAPIPVWVAVLRRRRCTCSAFSLAIAGSAEGAAARGDSGAAVLRVPGMIARTSAAGKMTVGGCNRALQGAAGALPRVADRTAFLVGTGVPRSGLPRVVISVLAIMRTGAPDSRCSCAHSVRSTQPVPHRPVHRTRAVCGGSARTNGKARLLCTSIRHSNFVPGEVLSGKYLRR